MSPTVHLIQGAAGAAILYPFIGGKAFIFGVSVVAIDLDHFVEYYRDTLSIDLKGFFEYHNILSNNLDNYLGLNLFHTIECYIILFFAGLILPDLHLILYGFLFHHLFDQIKLTWMKRPFARAFSIIEYFIRRKHYYTSLRELLAKKKKKSRCEARFFKMITEDI